MRYDESDGIAVRNRHADRLDNASGLDGPAGSRAAKDARHFVSFPRGFEVDDRPESPGVTRGVTTLDPAARPARPVVLVSMDWIRPGDPRFGLGTASIASTLRGAGVEVRVVAKDR